MKNSLKNFCTETKIFLIPILCIIFLVLLLAVPRNNIYWNFLRQAPFYTGIYFWQSQRPDAFNIFSAFILGVFADVLGSMPLGINIISFLILYITSAQFSIKFNVKHFSYSWFLFSLATIITLFFKTLILSIFYRKMIPVAPLFIELLLILAIYPLFARYYIWIERKYIHLEERYEKI